MIEGLVKIKEHLTVLSYSMSEGEMYQTIICVPSEGRRMLREFKETGKFTYKKPWLLEEEVIEPMAVMLTYTSDFVYKKRS